MCSVAHACLEPFYVPSGFQIRFDRLMEPTPVLLVLCDVANLKGILWTTKDGKESWEGKLGGREEKKKSVETLSKVISKTPR